MGKYTQGENLFLRIGKPFCDATTIALHIFLHSRTGKNQIQLISFLAALVLAWNPPQIFAQNERALTSDQNLDKVVLQLKWVHQFNFAGYYAAVEKGFYRDAGLDVIIREGRPGMDFVEEVISGRANYGVEMPEILIARHNGKPVVVLAAIFQHSPQIILAKAGSGINSPHNLIGKKVMWRFDSAAELRAMLINEKVPLEQIEFMELSWDLDDLVHGKVDAIHAYVTAQPFELKAAGIESAILSPITYGIDFYGDCLFTSEKEVAGHPARVKAFREASLRGWEYAMKNPEELIDIIRNKYGNQNTREFMRNEFNHINKLMLPELVEIGHMNPGRWKHIGDTFVELGMLDPGFTLAGFLYNPNPQPDSVKIKKAVWILLMVVLAACLSAVVLFVFNRRLNREVRSRTEHLTAEIAERERYENKFLRQHAQFHAIFDSITDAIVFVDLERRIVTANPAFKSILGYDLEEVKGKTTQLFYANPEEYHQQGRIRFHKYSRSETPVYEVEYRRKDGSVFPSETLGVPVKDASGENIGFLGVIRDVSERKEAESDKKRLIRQWARSQKLEAIGTLAGGVAHDFNNILGIIFGYAEIAKAKTLPGSKISHDLDKILQAGHRAKDLVQQILAFSRQAQIERISIDPYPVVMEALKMLRASIPSNIEIQENLTQDSGAVYVDPTQLNQVVLNLCTNAFHAMEENGGTISVVLRAVDSVPDELQAEGLSGEKGFVELSVSDTGKGIDSDIIDKIFDPFFTTKEKGKGTGMGLAITYGIIKDYGGTITVESQPGKGSAFHVFIPVTNREALSIQTQETIIPEGHERILFVDDEIFLVELGREILESLGYTVTVKQSSIEALNAFTLKPEQFDMVITDQTMPDMTGFEMARKMIAIRPDVPVILCTGYSNLVDEEVAKSQGIKGFVYKPFTKKDIACLIRQVLAKGNGDIP